MLVDVSGVVRDEALGGRPTLARLDLVLNAWRQQVDAFSEFVLIADRSLRHTIPKPEAKELERRFAVWGEYQLVPHADPLILERAQLQDAVVLTRDYYIDLSPRHPWMRRQPERFFTWKANAGEVAIIPRPEKRFNVYDVSRAAEAADLKAGGFPGRPKDHPELWMRYRCVSVACVARQASPDVLRVLPLRRGDELACPSCLGELEAVGARPEIVELKLQLGPRVVHRFSLGEGETAVIGRSTLPDTEEIRAAGEQGEIDALGRRHLELTLLNEVMRVRDLASATGIRVSRWSSKNHSYAKRKEQLERGGMARLGRRDAVLVGNLRIVRSGRAIAEADALSPPEGDAPWRAAPTRGT